MRKQIVSLAMASVVSISASAADVKSQIEHRQAIMEAIGGHFSAVFSTLKGPASEAANHQFHAETIARLAHMSRDVFPEGSDKGKTEAKADIWDKPDAFQEALDTFVTRADAFAAASKTGDRGELAKAAKNLGGSCKGCHDDFKKD